MWNTCEPPRRLRLNFDPLEDRRLLNGGYFPATQAESVPVSSGATMGTVWVSGHIGGFAGWGDPAASDGPISWGPALAVGSHAAGFYSTEPNPAGLTFVVEWEWGTAGWDRSAFTIEVTPSYSFWMAQSGSSMQPSDIASSVTPSNPSGSPSSPGPGSSGWVGGGFGGAAAKGSPTPSGSVSNQGLPGNSPSGGFDPGDFPVQSRTPAPAAPFASMNGPPLAPVQFFNGMRDRMEASDTGPSLVAALNAASGPSAPGAQPLAPLTSNLGAALVSTGQVQQAPPAGGALSTQPHPIASDADGSVGDRTVSMAMSSPSRGVVDPARGTQVLGRGVLATTLSHPERASSSSEPEMATLGADEAAPLPKGADLIAEALPFAGDSLERSLEEFVQQLRSVDVAGIVTQGPTPIVVGSLAIAGAAASAMVVQEVVRRRAGRGRGIRMTDSLGRELALSFPELPRSWSDKH
jgi:hypothetical protein